MKGEAVWSFAQCVRSGNYYGLCA